MARRAEVVGQVRGPINRRMPEPKENGGWFSSTKHAYNTSPRGSILHGQRSLQMFAAEIVAVRFRPVNRASLD